MSFTMDVFALVRACSNYKSDDDERPTATLLQPIGTPMGIIFEIVSYGRQLRFTLRPTSLVVEYLGGSGDLSEVDFPPKRTTSPLVLTCCWFMVQKCWHLKYNVIKSYCSNLEQYSRSLLRALLLVTEFDRKWKTLYLSVFAILNSNEDNATYTRQVAGSSGYPVPLRLYNSHGLKLYLNDSELCHFDTYAAVNVFKHLQTQLRISKFWEGSDTDTDTDTEAEAEADPAHVSSFADLPCVEIDDKEYSYISYHTKPAFKRDYNPPGRYCWPVNGMKGRLYKVLENKKEYHPAIVLFSEDDDSRMSGDRWTIIDLAGLSGPPSLWQALLE
jgi:hypothetical protein